MKVLVTGAFGFMGKNLVAELKNHDEYNVLCYGRGMENELSKLARDCDFVFHFAGVNRPKEEKEFMEGNRDFTENLIKNLLSNPRNPSIIMTSSIQAELDNSYGISKKAGEEAVLNYGRKTGANVYIYRLPNVFGKWCRPEYNSVVATFCHHIAHGLPIKINNAETKLKLVYIDDVLENFIKVLDSELKNKKKDGDSVKSGYMEVSPVHQITLGELADTIRSFPETRRNISLPDLGNDFEKKLYSTYLSYLPEDCFSYGLDMHKDERGSFTEFIRTPERGQFSVNISKPGITKGNHWHHTKNEKFLVVKGKGIIRFRKIGEDKIIEYPVYGEKLEVVDIPCGYTHSIENTGSEDMVTLMWANEPYDKDKPDTYFEPVEKK